MAFEKFTFHYFIEDGGCYQPGFTTVTENLNEPEWQEKKMCQNVKSTCLLLIYSVIFSHSHFFFLKSGLISFVSTVTLSPTQWQEALICEAFCLVPHHQFITLSPLSHPPCFLLLSIPVPPCAFLLSLSSSLSCPLNLVLALCVALSLSCPLWVCNGSCHPGGCDAGRGQGGNIP